MPRNVTVTDDDVGKRVVDRSGTVVGSVAEARNGVAYVDPDTAITATYLATLGGSYAADGSSFRIDPATIERIADREIRIR
ncbi:PRC-barrel domain containing protein [Salinigranum sp. GCM10025319]|uniref:PRC-barrel domain containing protein n=1 Tax=Salinigranum sp. GCM10025319 TaxID=3252687 RepID=UPI0036120587